MQKQVDWIYSPTPLMKENSGITEVKSKKDYDPTQSNFRDVDLTEHQMKSADE
jgi:hypothetical protein